MSQRPAAVAVAETSGRLGEAGYLFLRPADWNGDLVPFGHAAESPFPPAGRFWFPLPLGFGPQTAGMPFAHNRDAALCHGFAWAASASERYGGAAHERAMADPSTLQRMASNHLPGSERFDPADVGHNVLWGDPTAPDAQAAFVSLGEGWSVEEIVDLNARVPRYASDPLAERYWTFHQEPSGALEIPLVVIRGPSAQVPSHYWAYADRLNRTGSRDLYSGWAIPTHEQEDLRQNMGTALRALVAWIETGTRPAWPTNP